MDLKFLRLFEEFEEGKFSLDDINTARKMRKSIFGSIVKDFPKHDPKKPLDIVDVDTQTGEIVVKIDNNIYYMDIKNVEEIER